MLGDSNSIIKMFGSKHACLARCMVPIMLLDSSDKSGCCVGSKLVTLIEIRSKHVVLQNLLSVHFCSIVLLMNLPFNEKRIKI